MFNKRLVSAIVICLAIGLTLQQEASPEKKQVCSSTATDSQSNILKWLKAQSIELYENSAVEKDSKVCVGHFNVYGTCCKGTSVKAYIDKQNEAVISKWKAYLSAMAPIKNKMAAALKRLANKMSSKDLENKKSLLGAAASVLRPALKMLPSTPEQVATLKSFLQDFDTKGISTFKAQASKCYDVLKTARANSICALCSTNNAVYTSSATSTTDAIKIRFRAPMEACRSIVDTCYPIWRFNWLLTTSIQYVLVLRSKGKGDKATYPLKNSFTMNDDVMTNLASTFNACNINNSTNKIACIGAALTVDDHYKRLCSQAVVLNKENSAIEGDASLGTIDASDVAKAADEDAEGDKNKDTVAVAARILQGIAPSSFPESEVGFDASTSTTDNFPLADPNTGSVPTPSVDASKVGEEAPSAAMKIAASLFALFASLVVLA